MARTYVPQLRKLSQDLAQYIGRYFVKLDGSLDDPTFASLEAAYAAVNELLLALGEEILLP
jgi:hypothetical protein